MQPGKSSDPAPLELVVDESGAAVRVRVIATGSRDAEADFELEVAGGTNRSRHRGSASVRTGQAATVSTVALSPPAGAGWLARLRVQPRGEEAYEIVRSGGRAESEAASE